MDNECGYSEGAWKGQKERDEITLDLMLQWRYRLLKYLGY